MKKCEDVFEAAKKFIQTVKLKRDADFIIVDLHGEITSEKMAMGYFFDGKANNGCWNPHSRSNFRS